MKFQKWARWSRRFAPLAVAVAFRVDAQNPMLPASEISGFVRLLELQGKATGSPLVYWSSSTTPRTFGLTVDSAHLWSERYSLAPAAGRTNHFRYRLLDARADLSYNSGFPRSENDGAAWAGRGVSALVQGGAEVRWGPFTGRFYPSLVYAQNSAFELGQGPGTAKSPYAYPWHVGIDFPQRFGTTSVAVFDFGQSGLRLDFGALTVGFSTENLWWGPGFRNSITMGSAAPGVPHVDIGTGRPLHFGVGDVEFRAISGALKRSEYFGTSTTDGRRIVNGFTAGFRPAILPGLTLGATRVLYHYWPRTGLSSADFLDAFSVLFNPGNRLQPNGILGNDQADQMASVSGRWVLPESGFEAYFEYARGDFAGSLRDLELEPDHMRAYTVGFQKVVPTRTGTTVLRAETTNLAGTLTYNFRDGDAVYTHSIVAEGYTNRGQLLGAAIGPGSNAQYMGLDRYTAQGRYGIFAERVRYDDDYAF